MEKELNRLQEIPDGPSKEDHAIRAEFAENSEEHASYRTLADKACLERADVDRNIDLLERAYHEVYNLNEKIKTCKVREKLVQYKKLLKMKNKEVSVLHDTLTVELEQWARATYVLLNKTSPTRGHRR